MLMCQPSFQRLVLTGNIRMRTQIVAERNSTGPLRRPHRDEVKVMSAE